MNIDMSFSGLMKKLSKPKLEQHQYQCDCGKGRMGPVNVSQKCSCGQTMVKLVVLSDV